MLGSVINTALSGLQASSQRVNNSANNIANIHSTTSLVKGERVLEPFRPQDVTQTTIEPRGVRAGLRERDPSSIAVYDPTNVAADAEGITQYPNVSLDEELIQTKIGGYDFKANLKSIQAADEMLGSLLDIVA